MIINEDHQTVWGSIESEVTLPQTIAEVRAFGEADRLFLRWLCEPEVAIVENGVEAGMRYVRGFYTRRAIADDEPELRGPEKRA